MRRWNVREWADYEGRIQRRESVVAGTESLDGPARELERSYLGLRTDAGLPIGLVPARTVAAWCREGWATSTSDRIRLTIEGWLRLDALVGAAQDS